MSNENALALMPKSLGEVQTLAEMLAKSDLLPEALRGKPADVAVQVMSGQELGVPPMAAIRSVHVVQGKPILSADLMVALAYGSGKCVYFKRVAETSESVTYETLRVGWDKPQQLTWTLQMAKDASLHLKDNWRGHRRQMLAARAKAELARDAYPDVLAGVMTDDEATDVSFAGKVQASPSTAPAIPATDDISDAEIVLDGAMDPAEKALADIEAATSLDQLEALAKDIVGLKLTGAAKTTVNEKYKARKKLFKELMASQPAPAAEAPAPEVAA